MNIEKNYLFDLFQSIKHFGRKLSKDEISSMLLIVKDEYNKELFGIALLCLSYGSQYIGEQEPFLFKKLLEKDLNSCDIAEVFDCIRVTGLSKFYEDEIIKYSMFVNWDFDEFEANSYAVEALGNYIFQSKNKELFNLLLKQYNLAHTKLNTGISDFDQDDYLFLFRSYFSAINFSIEGSKSYTRKRITMDDLKNNRVSIPQWKG